MSEEGRYIPADVRRQVLTEAGHACAIPTCKFPATEFAHIEPYAKVKEHKASNIIALCPNHHTMYDQKKGIDRKSMLAYKRNLQFLNSRYTKYELRILAILADKPAALAAGEVQCMGLLNDGLIKNVRTLQTTTLKGTNNETGEVEYEEDVVAAFIAQLTTKGREFVQSWKDDVGDLVDAI